MGKTFLKIEYLKEYVSSNPLPKDRLLFPISNKPINQVKSEVYQEILDNLTFYDYTKAAIEELKEILSFDKSLDQAKVREWTNINLGFFSENLFLFGIDHLDTAKDENIYLPRLDEYVDKIPFIPIIQFWECMWLLHFGQYHLDIEKRSPPDPIGSYYYSIPDPNEPKDIEKILNYLGVA